MAKLPNNLDVFPRKFHPTFLQELSFSHSKEHHRACGKDSLYVLFLKFSTQVGHPVCSTPYTTRKADSLLSLSLLLLTGYCTVMA